VLTCVVFGFVFYYILCCPAWKLDWYVIDCMSFLRLMVTSKGQLYYLLPHAVNCVSFCFWRCLWLFCMYMKYLRNRWTD